MTALALRPVVVATSCADEVGRLVFADGRLVAVLVRLEAEFHDEARGSWFVEAGFGPCADHPPPFATLPDAVAWIGARVGADPAALPAVLAAS